MKKNARPGQPWKLLDPWAGWKRPPVHRAAGLSTRLQDRGQNRWQIGLYCPEVREQSSAQRVGERESGEPELGGYPCPLPTPSPPLQQQLRLCIPQVVLTFTLQGAFRAPENHTHASPTQIRPALGFSISHRVNYTVHSTKFLAWTFQP